MSVIMTAAKRRSDIPVSMQRAKKYHGTALAIMPVVTDSVYLFLAVNACRSDIVDPADYSVGWLNLTHSLSNIAGSPNSR
jgi:hypothetical protein